MNQPVSPGGGTESAAKPKEYCDPSGGVADGVELEEHPARLTLSIERAELGVFDGQQTVTMSLKLKNDGVESTSIPWSSNPVEPVPVSGEGQGKTVGYEVATIDFFFGRPHRSDPVLALRGEAALWAQPGNLSQLIKIQPGEWIELKFRARVICKQGDSASCLSMLNLSKLQVSAWWYQRLLTTTMHNDCIYQNGAYTQNEIDSGVTDVVSSVPQAPQPTESMSPTTPATH